MYLLLSGIFCQYFILNLENTVYSQYTENTDKRSNKYVGQMAEEGEIFDDLSDSGGAELKLTGADCRVWCVISNVRRCELMRQNVRQEGMPRCMHVAPRWGLRWYNFTILISHDHNSREWTIQTFLFHELFLLAIFLSNPILWVSRSRRRILDTVGEAPDPFWDEHNGGSHVVMVSWCHGVITLLSLIRIQSARWQAYDTLTAPVKWKFNKISQQKIK